MMASCGPVSKKQWPNKWHQLAHVHAKGSAKLLILNIGQVAERLMATDCKAANTASPEPPRAMFSVI
jgi:hypothetical protein